MPTFFILASLCAVVLAYVVLSWHERNFVNILFPFMILGVPAYFLFEFGYTVVFGRAGTDFAYFYCYLCYAVKAVGMVAGYALTPSVVVPIFIEVPRVRIPAVPFICLCLGAALYAPILITHADLLFAPREIYSVTRTGFGIEFFMSTFMVYLGFIILLFRDKFRAFNVWMFVLPAALLLYMHGSKGQLLNFALIALYFAVFVRGWRVGLARFAFLGLGLLAAGLVLFYVTFSPEMKQDFALSIVSYSDYTRNSLLVVDDRDLDPQLGRLTFEEAIYSAVPRAVFADKPKDFGEFWLVKRYFRGRFDSDTGSPAFGLGVAYADFGVFSVFYFLAGALVTGAVLKLLIVRLRARPDSGTFLLFLVLMNVQIIPSGGEIPFILYYGLAHVARFLSYGRSRNPQDQAAARQIASSHVAT